MPRTAEITRKTNETDLRVRVDLDGRGEAQVKTGIGFFDHMLEALARHSLMDLTVEARGDLHVDGHHTVEDTGIVLGQAIAQALGDRAGIRRYADAMVPLDEALVRCVVDVSGRPYLSYNIEIPKWQMLGEYDVFLTPEFFRALVLNAGLTVHLDLSEATIRTTSSRRRSSRSPARSTWPRRSTRGLPESRRPRARCDRGGRLRGEQPRERGACAPRRRASARSDRGSRRGPPGRSGAGAGGRETSARLTEPGNHRVGDAVREVAQAGRPVMGICLGLQLFFETARRLPRHGAGFFRAGYAGSRQGCRFPTWVGPRST